MFRIVGGLFGKTVVDQVGKMGPAAGQMDRLYETIAASGVHMKKSKLKKKSLNLATSDFRKVSFAGADAEKIMHPLVYEKLLAEVFPAASRATTTHAQNLHTRCLAAWAAWAAVWKLLGTELQCSKAAWAERAKEVRRSRSMCCNGKVMGRINMWFSRC
jgi:hypothetical protein